MIYDLPSKVYPKHFFIYFKPYTDPQNITPYETFIQNNLWPTLNPYLFIYDLPSIPIYLFIYYSIPKKEGRGKIKGVAGRDIERGWETEGKERKV